MQSKNALEAVDAWHRGFFRTSVRMEEPFRVP
jgi:hypothetical protein